MEVHHHPEVEKKGFKEYLLEGLMIFLAVMMGFFAESLREHIADKGKAHEYAQSLYQETVNDSLFLNKDFFRYKLAYHALDSLVQLLSHKNSIPQDKSGLAYYLCGIGMYNSTYTPNVTTLQQLKNSGSLRYFDNLKIENAISDYDQKIDNMKEFETIAYQNFIETRKLQYKLFDATYILEPGYWGSAFINPLLKIRNERIPLINNDPLILKEFTNWINNREALLDIKVKKFNELLSSRRKLIQLLKTQYHLKNE